MDSRLDSSIILVREYNADTDLAAAAEVERKCDLRGRRKMSLFTHLLGDPASRVRHSPTNLMLVAEMQGSVMEIVGLVRGCVKDVTCGKSLSRQGDASPGMAATPVYTKVGYLLGLRVSPSHRRKGIALMLVKKMEAWFREKRAEYAYISTEKDNEASMRLFTGRCGYTQFRTPSILVHPVYAHRLAIPRSAAVLRLGPADAEAIYRGRFDTIEFFPRDIDAVLRNPLTIATFLAVPAGSASAQRWEGAKDFLAAPPASWVVASVWDCSRAFQLEVRGASWLQRGAAAATRAADRAMPWLQIPAVPDLFRPFGHWFLYGVAGEGPMAAEMAAAAWREAHNVARGGAAVLVAEVAPGDAVRRGIPWWRRLSCAEDIWCVKRLGEEYGDGGVGDWTKSAPGASIFVDPREV